MGNALILGGAACLWNDLLALTELNGGREWDATVIAVNEAGIHYPGHIDHWVSLHPDKFRIWEPRRTGDRVYETWGRKPRPEIGERPHHVVRHPGGSSGMLAVVVAREELKLEPVVLCGVPLDDSPHLGDDKPWKDFKVFTPDWERLAPDLMGKVKSMSGWTAKLLGSPDAAWLRREAKAA